MVPNKNQHQDRLKERFVVLQDYAHLMFLTEIDKRDCVNNGIYSSSIKECQQCDLKKECECINNKSSKSMMDSDLMTLVKDIEIAKNYIERTAAHNIEEDGTCYCDSCAWIAEFDGTLSESIRVIRHKLNDVELSIESTKNRIKEIKL